jgi:hypothetical protein
MVENNLFVKYTNKNARRKFVVYVAKALLAYI